ncbi:hypothetical protein GCM10010211_28230 [Streptomyces albospinus]|uniref:Secreted protein n=1 Tax=Streptomyces albospinus TaxID=285515 RepID=A0ABQ2V1J5_9ACTN|nr:hypothetical protein [Streptomyces albospinus]GGU61575.1 hypothetical protein GCM10010211_28230 [Streptomyces albospinus]
MRRKDTGTAGISRLVARLRMPLTALAVVLAFLLGAAASPCKAKPAVPAAAAVKSASTAASANAGSDEEKHPKRETERGRPRRVAPSSADPAPTRRARPPFGTDTASDSAAGRQPAGLTSSAASRPDQLPVLHCVFRC